jgi:hypothetical protein
LLFIIEFSRLSIKPVSWSNPSFVGFKSPTASGGLFLSIILALLVKMSSVALINMPVMLKELTLIIAFIQQIPVA